MLTIWTARIAAALYVCAMAMLICRQWRPARAAYTLGLLAYLMHVWCAFEYSYAWSHEIAYRETARQTAELFGLRWGGGLYMNYLFTGLWMVDCLKWWTTGTWRPNGFVQAFLIFMIVNGTLVVWAIRAVR